MAIVFTYSQGFSQSGTCAGATELIVTDPGDEIDFTLTPANQTTIGKGDNGGNTTPDVFYYITPNVVKTINIGLCQFNNFDSEIRIYSDCTLTTLIAENDDGDCGTSSEVSFQSDGVSTYYILIEGNENPIAPPDNDFEGIFGISVWYTAAVPTPPIAQGINCNSSTSGPSLLFTDELDVQGTWTGDIATSQAGGSSNSGMWEIIATGGASSNNTGPSAPFSGITYMNYEGSGNGANDNNHATASAVSEAIDLSGTITEDVELSFYMHAFGNQIGTLNVGIGTSPAGPFTTEFTWAGQFQSSSDITVDPWFHVGVDLTSYLGQTIYIEFSHTGTGNGFQGDMSIDLVEVNACDTVLDVNEENILENMTVFPNPVNDILTLKAQENIETISIYNLLGQEVLRTQPKVLNTNIDMSSLPTGMYVVKVQVGDSIGSYKIVKN